MSKYTYSRSRLRGGGLARAHSIGSTLVDVGIGHGHRMDSPGTSRHLEHGHECAVGVPPRSKRGHHVHHEHSEASSGGGSRSHHGRGAKSRSKAAVHVESEESVGTGGTGSHRPLTVGICAMNKKTLAPPMQNILTRLSRQVHMQIIIFSDDTILNTAVEDWPICNCFIAFYSFRFPLDKAIQYVRLRKPMVINDLEMQYDLMDRRRVYEILTQNGVEVPKYAVLNRSEDDSGDTIVETDDTIEIRGQVFHKPFVEKPISAEDHSIYIYFPSDYGGGSQRLFRKVNDRSSCYSEESAVRKTGSYIYEEFLPTDGTDVKVYTVGPDYAHAEARKSPSLDGKVERDAVGKEKRYPVILTAAEKLIARRVCLAFKQTVCGFDLLRANGRSYVCDVNGFSFVKKSQKYYEDCSQILMEMITAKLAPHFFPHIPPSVEYLAEEVPVPIPKTGVQLELRCVIGIIRHGDRTPKQKMKMLVKHRKFFELFEELNGYRTGQLKIKKPKQLQKVLDIARYLLENVEKYHESYEIEEKVHKLQQLRSVLEMYGHFSGINRKVQFKLLNKWGPRGESLLLLILKWGGELTPAGQVQAEELGRAFRCMYPGGEGEYASLPGSGFLRLHSTYRHDLKVYASDEGRVQMTAAAFTKGLLDLEGNLASILVHLVKRDQNATNMLDTSTDAHEPLFRVKERLHDLLRSDKDFSEESYRVLAPTGAESLIDALRHIHNPREVCEHLQEEIHTLVGDIKDHMTKGTEVQLYHAETLQMMLHRWEKLEKDFKAKTGRFDISKIPDIYDCIKYDLTHNSQLALSNATALLRIVVYLADVVIPQEYGMTKEEKLDIGLKICTPILRKIQADLQHTIVNEHSDIIHRLDPRQSQGVITPNRHVRTRLYFTSESHVHTMLSILRYGGLIEHSHNATWVEAMQKVSSNPELNYMTQIVLMLFEDLSQPEGSDLRYRVDLHFSPGVKGRDELLKGRPTSSNTKLSPDLLAKSLQPVKRLSYQHFTDGVWRPPLGTKDSLTTTPIVLRKLSAPILKSASDSQLGRHIRRETQPAFPVAITGRVLARQGSEFSSTSEMYSSSTSLLERGLDLDEMDMVGFEDQLDSDDSRPGFRFVVGSQSPPKKTLKELASFAKVIERLPDNPEIGGLTLAAELSSTVEPLLPLCSVPLPSMNSFLSKMSGVTLNYEPVNHPTTNKQNSYDFSGASSLPSMSSLASDRSFTTS